MQTVIGSYDLFEDAQRAVRDLEQHRLSIQDVVISDQKGHGWREGQEKREERVLGVRLDARFLVLMSGEVNVVNRARRILTGSS